jgi:hypothetical protein
VCERGCVLVEFVCVSDRCEERLETKKLEVLGEEDLISIEGGGREV